MMTRKDLVEGVVRVGGVPLDQLNKDELPRLGRGAALSCGPRCQAGAHRGDQDVGLGALAGRVVRPAARDIGGPA